MQFNERNLIELIEAFISRINLFSFGLFVVAVSALSIYFPFPLNEVFVAFISLFFPGYLFYRLIIKESFFIETFVVSVILSMGIIVFSTFLLTVTLNFPFNKTTITSAAVLSTVIFLGIHFLRGALTE
jgi:hypothetical protein